MRYITADYIFPISSAPIKNGVVIVSDDNKIVELATSNVEFLNANIERYEGIICPGFINAHCHLELSHMKGLIDEKQGMAGFIRGMISKRNLFSAEQIADAIVRAEKEMYDNGIVGVGDISNNNDTLFQKQKRNLKYHTFFEVFDLNPSKAEAVYSNATELQKVYLKLMLSVGADTSASIVPHAPYSVSPDLFKLIASQGNGTLISYHNQESIAESELYINKSGTIAELFSSMGINLEYIKSNGKNSLQSTLPFISNEHKRLFVHNTYTTQKDIKLLCSLGPIQNSKPQTQNHQVYFCLCPNANLYIENRLPDINLFINESCNILIGTDSLASNYSLSVLDELKTISKYFPEVALQTLLTWATKNGAEFFEWDSDMGTIEKGKRPGLVLISNIDEEKVQITEKSESKRLV